MRVSGMQTVRAPASARFSKRGCFSGLYQLEEYRQGVPSNGSRAVGKDTSRVTTTVLPAASANWLLPFAATLIAMFALQLSNLGFCLLYTSDAADERSSV